MARVDEPAYACRCLNVRLHKGTSEGAEQATAGAAASEAFKPFFVGDDGIQIIHNELTLRRRSPVSVDAKGVHTQLTTIQCLVCETHVYRVSTEISEDADAKEGPVLPTDEWTEKDTLVSKNGWVFVHVGAAGCVNADENKRKTASPSLSTQYSILIPNNVNHTTHQANLHSSRTSIPPNHDFLPGLGPFLPPPPFTSTHPMFLHLSSIASERSKAARDMSSKAIEDYTKQQMGRLGETETKLRAELEGLWMTLKQNLRKVEMERDGHSGNSRRRSMSPGARALSPTALGGVGSPRISSFVPAPAASTRPFSPQNRQSALATSLITTGLHHPRERQASESRQIVTPSPPPYTSKPSSSAGSAGSMPSGIDIARPQKRNMDENNDTAVTYQYFAIEEQEAARQKQKKMELAKDDTKAKSSRTASKPDAPKAKECENPKEPTTEQPQKDANGSVKASTQNPDKKGDGKRKVTFDAHPNIVTIKRDVKEDDEDETLPERADDLLFEYDEDANGANGQTLDQSSTESKENDAEPSAFIPKVSQKSQRSSETTTRRHARQDPSEGLPQSFAALRPSSLPAPSHIRPSIRARLVGPKKKSESSERLSKPRRAPIMQPEVSLTSQQLDIRKLVGADMPIHRGSWKAGADSWKIFEGNNSDQTDEEESEGDTESTVTQFRGTGDRELQGMPGSLPIPMPSLTPQLLSGTKSLQPKTSLTDRPGALVPPLTTISEEDDFEASGEGQKKKSAAARRKMVYAERDRVRDMDPGMLDFTNAVADGVDPDEEEEDVSTSRSRRHAFNIIKARNSVPAEGLWRSLA